MKRRANAIVRALTVVRVLTVGLAALTSVACGYQAVRYSETFGETNRIAVNGFRNDTFEAGVDAVVTDAIATEVMRRGALRLVDDPGTADWVLTGVVVGVETSNRSFSSVAFSLEYEVSLGLDVTIARRDGTTLKLDPNALRDSERYLASADVEVTRSHREEAIRRLASLLAGRIHDAFYETAALAEVPGATAP